MANKLNEENGNVFQRLKKHIMDLAYGEGEDDDFDAIADLYEDIETIRSMMQDLDSDRDYYRRESAKKTIKITNLEKLNSELQKEKEALEKALNAGLILNFDEKFNE